MLKLNSPTLKFSISGLRGIVPEDLNLQNLPQIIYAFEKSIPAGVIALARDTRPTGSAFCYQAMSILNGLGRQVHFLDIVPTPTIKHYVRQNNLAGGIMVSASHNPMHYNAFKFIRKGGDFFLQKDNEKFKNSLKKYHPQVLLQTKFDKYAGALDKKKDSIKAHIEQCKYVVFGNKNYKLKMKPKVALDTLAACATEMAPQLLQSLGCTFITQYETFETKFPRPPEPTISSLKKFEAFCKTNKADIGFAFDPDADRLVIIDENGSTIHEELTLPLAAMSSLSKKSVKGSMVVNLSSSYLSQWVAEQKKIPFLRSKVGEANVVELMRKKKAIFGGEGNGGVIDPEIDSFGRDTISGICHILNLLEKKKTKKISTIIAALPSFYMHKSKFETSKISMNEIAQKIEKFQKSSLNRNLYKIDKRDGMHLSHKSGIPWIHIRESNTEPIIRLICEGINKNQVKKFLANFI
jgi:phosphomannomutase